MPRTKGTFGSVERERNGRYRARYTVLTAAATERRPCSSPSGTRVPGLRCGRPRSSARHGSRPSADQKPAKTDLRRIRRTVAGPARPKDRTREHYRKLLDQRLLKAPFASLPLASITSDDVRAWHAKFGTKTPTMRAHCYGLLRTIMATAASDGKIAVNPCVIRGAGTATRVHKIRPATLDELAIIAREMPEQFQPMILLASWCALRFGKSPSYAEWTSTCPTK